jgi:hypothetical protein
MVTEDMSTLQRGHRNTLSSAGPAWLAAAPQWGQCLLPMNIVAKQEGQATVANFDSQYWHRGASDDIAAPQFGQLRVSTRIRRYCISGAALRRVEITRGSGSV